MAAEKQATKPKSKPRAKAKPGPDPEPRPHKPSEWLPRVDQLYRFTTEQYRKLGEAGIFKTGEHVELIGGVIVAKMTKKEQHIYTVKKSYRTLDRALPAGWHVSKEDPILLSTHDEPEPDLAVLRGGIDDYKSRKPGPEDIALVVEVADASLADDRRKRTLYAAADIPVYWIINLRRRRIEIYSDPDPAGFYRTARQVGADGPVPLEIGGAEVGRINASDLLP